MQVPAGDKALWAAQDGASEALPSALSRAFCGVQEQFFDTSKARPCHVSSSRELASGVTNTYRLYRLKQPLVCTV